MALPHASPGSVVGVRPLGPALQTLKTHAVFKARDLELIRLVLPAGRSLPPHKVEGEITVHCIEGRIEVTAQGQAHVVAAGELLLLEGGALHAVLALEDSSALVTIALR